MLGSLQIIKEVSSGGEVWIVFTSEAECAVDSIKHCGGYGRKNKQEYIHYLYMAYRSYCEFETQLLLASDLD